MASSNENEFGRKQVIDEDEDTSFIYQRALNLQDDAYGIGRCCRTKGKKYEISEGEDLNCKGINLPSRHDKNQHSFQCRFVICSSFFFNF